MTTGDGLQRPGQSAGLRGILTATVTSFLGQAVAWTSALLNSVLGSAIISIGRERRFAGMAAIALAFNLSLNLSLIPRYQHVGAAIVTSLTELLLLVLSLLALPRHLLPVGSVRVGIKALAASAIMAALVWVLPISSSCS
jgi:O-antigen/teichoic acid export membrane protein